jgi:hypothetical protein
VFFRAQYLNAQQSIDAKMDLHLKHLIKRQPSEISQSTTKSLVSPSEINKISKGIFSWQIPELLIMFLFLAMTFWIVGEEQKYPSTNPYYSIIFALLSLLMFYFIVVLSWRIDRRTNFISSLRKLNKFVNNSDEKTTPPDDLVSNFDIIRHSLLSWISRKGFTPRSDYYNKRLRTEIEVFFSVIPELLYRTWYSKQRKEKEPWTQIDELDWKNGEAWKKKNVLSYSQAERWAVNISLQMVGNRKIMRRSVSDYNTLLYLFEEINKEICIYDESIVNIHRSNVKEFFDNRGTIAKARKDSYYAIIRDILIAAVTLLLTITVVYFGFKLA